MKRLTVILLVFFANFVNAQEITAAQAAAQLNITAQAEAKGSFEQKKYFQLLKKPFVTTGQYEIDPTTFIWHTLHPIEQVIRYQDGNLQESNAQGEFISRPQALPYVALIKPILNGDFAALESQFTLVNDQGSCIKLVPKQTQMAQLFASFSICGKDKIQKITLFDRQNNKTEIHLYPPTH
jgi:hypothetical protein